MDEQQLEQLTVSEQAEQRARAYFREGLNCAECVMLSFLDTHETGYPPEIIGLTSGFGGGIGQTKHICGAVTGALMALGTQKGRKNPFLRETPPERSLELRQEVYPAFAALVNALQDHYGTLICADLTADYDEFDGKARKKSCQEIIAYCAALVAKHAEDGMGLV